MPVRRIARQLARPLLFVLVAAQLLQGVPVMASSPPSGSSHHEMPCDQVPTPAADDSCPCCPDGAGSMNDCLASCTLAAAIAPSIFSVHVVSSVFEAFVDSSYRATALSDPPLKPPPIA
jgi:hypothetical protein